MTDVLDIDPAQLNRAVPKFEAAAEALSEALMTLTEVLCTTSQMCGDDDIGKKFFNAYNDVAKDVQKALDKAGVGVAKIGTAVGQMSKNCADMDDNNAQACRPTGGG